MPANADGLTVGVEAPIVTASPTTLAEHPHAAVVAYGSATTNAIVASLIERTGWKIAKDHIAIAGKTFTGEHLVLVACAPRADDPEHGIAIYAAHDDRDLVGLTGRRGSDWTVLRKTAGGFELVGYGDFPFGADGSPQIAR
jgi:hypothetical protein